MQIASANLIATSEAAVEILRFYDHQMGEHLSTPIPLFRTSAGLWESKSPIGGIELVGKLLYLRFSNKKIPFMVILEQNKECLAATTNCRGLPLRSYGYALQTKDEAVVQIYITANEGRLGSTGGSYQLTGRLKNQFHASYLDPNTNTLKIRFAGAHISATLQPDSAGDFGFALKADLPHNSKKVLGQVLLLLTPKGSLALGIGSLQTDKIPYSLTSPPDASLLHQTPQEPYSTADSTLRFYFSFCFACFMIKPASW